MKNFNYLIQQEKLYLYQEDLEKMLKQTFDDLKEAKFTSEDILRIEYLCSPNTVCVANLKCSYDKNLFKIWKHSSRNIYITPDDKNIEKYIKFMKKYKNNIERWQGLEYLGLRRDIINRQLVEVYSNKKDKNLYKICGKEIIFINGNLESDITGVIRVEELYELKSFNDKLDKKYKILFISNIINFFKDFDLSFKNEYTKIEANQDRIVLEKPKKEIVKPAYIDKLKDSLKMLENLLSRAYEENVIDENSIFNEYYIPELNKSIEKYKYLDEKSKSQVSDNIYKLNRLLIEKLEDKEKFDLMKTKAEIDTLNKKLSYEIS